MVADNGNSLPAPDGDAPGGAGAIDTTNPKDQAAIRNAIKRWPKRFDNITDERKRRWVQNLDIAESAARNVVAIGGVEDCNVMEAAKVLISVSKTGAMMEALNQKDDHAEAGGAGVTVNVGVKVVVE